MASLLQWLGAAADKIIPGDQSSWHPQLPNKAQAPARPQPPPPQPQFRLPNLGAIGSAIQHTTIPGLKTYNVGNLYNDLVQKPVVNPLLQGGRELTNLSNATNPYNAQIRAQARPVNIPSLVGNAAITGINAATLGKGSLIADGAERLAAPILGKIGSQLGKKAVTNLVRTTTEALPATAAYGGAGTLASGDTNPLHILKGAAQSALVAPLAGVAHGALPLAGAGIKATGKGVPKLKGTLAEVNKALGQSGHLDLNAPIDLNTPQGINDRVNSIQNQLDAMPNRLNAIRAQIATNNHMPPAKREQLLQAEGGKLNAEANALKAEQATHIQTLNQMGRNPIPEASIPQGVPGVPELPKGAAYAGPNSHILNPSLSQKVAGVTRQTAEPFMNKEPGPTSIMGILKDQRGAIDLGAPIGKDEAKTVEVPKSTPRAPQSLNTDRLNISDAAKGEVNALSQADPVTHMSDKEVQGLAKSSGIDLRSHSIEQTRQVVANQLNLRQKVVSLSNQADKLLADGKIGERSQLLQQIQELSRTSTEQGTNIARQLSARRILANELDTPMQRVFKLLDKDGVNPDVAAEKFAKVDFNDANAVVKAYRELVPPTAGNWLDTVRYNSMLSSPLTQINNIFPNFESTAQITPIEKTLTGLLDVAHSALTGKPRQFATGEGAAYVKGYFSSIGEAKRRFGDSLSGKTEATNLDMKGHVPMYAHGQNKAYDVLSFPMRLMEAMDGFFTGLTEGGVTKALEHRQSVGIKLVNQGLPERPTVQQIEKFAIGRKVSPSDRGNVGTIIKINPDNATATVHFKGKEGEATKDFPFSELAGLKTLRKSPDGNFASSAPDILKNTAQAESAYRLYRQELGDKSQGNFLQALDIPAQKLMELRNSKNPYVAYPAKFTVPFVRTTMNIFKQGFEYSPAGVLTIHGAANKTEQLSKMLLGTTVVGTAGAMLGHNRLTWAQPTNAKQLEAWKAAGLQPYSVKIGNNWVSFQKLPPAISFNLALVAALDDSQKNAKINQNGVDNVMDALAKYGQFLSDQSYTKSAGNFLKAVQGDKQAVTQLAAGYPQQLIPFRALSNWFANMTDDKQRKINTDAGFAAKQLEALMQTIPGLREHTTTVNDPNGQPVPAQHPLLNSVSPAKISTENAPGVDYYNGLKQTALDNSNKRITNAANKTATPKGPKLAQNISTTSKATLTDYSKLDAAGKARFNADPANKLRLHQAQYEDNKLSGKLTGAKDLAARQSLAKEAVTSKYPQEVQDFYALSKAQQNAYFAQDRPAATKLYDQAKKLDAELTSSGLTATKYKYGLGTKPKAAKKLKPPTLTKASGTSSIAKLLSGSRVSLKTPKLPKAAKVATAKIPKVATFKLGKASKIAVRKKTPYPKLSKGTV
jgi:hypothetical protein